MKVVTDRRVTHLLWWAAVLAILFTACLRLQHIVSFVEWSDEIRTLWRTQGDLGSLLIRTPSDWPPTYGIITWMWVRLVGPTLEASRFLSVLFGLLAAALTYRAAYAFHQQAIQPESTPTEQTSVALSAFLSMLVFATLGYLIFAGVDVRAYGLLLMCGALAFWQTQRWLMEPNVRRGITVMVALTVLLFISYTSTVFIAYLSLYVLVIRPRLILRWVAIGIGVMIPALPLLFHLLNGGIGRVAAAPTQIPPPFVEAMLNIYRDFGGSPWFLLPFAAAGLIVLWNTIRYPAQCRTNLLLLIWVLFPVAVYVIVGSQEFLKPRYMWWVALGIALLIGYAALRLPRFLQYSALFAFILLPAIPSNFDAYRLAVTSSPPIRQTLAWFAHHLRPDDILIIDPYCTCGDAFAWDYFVPQYFPTGYLPIVEQPGQNSRVWYLSTSGWQRDDELAASIENGRNPSIFYGPWFFLLRLYEGPPMWEGISFSDRLAFHGAEIGGNNTIMARDESFSVRLWWSAQQPLDVDYSFSLAIIDAAGQLIVQADGPVRMTATPEQTSAWIPGTYYEDMRSLRLPPDIVDGDYRLVVTVYQWWDGERLAPTPVDGWQTADEEGSLLVLQHIIVTS